MASLILTLPLASGSATPEYDYLLTPDGLQVGAQGHAAAALLPGQNGRDNDIVALIPARAVSWHRITLPDKLLRSMLGGRMEAARVRSVLAGVLEERLLDDADALHFAVFAAPTGTADEGGNAWVAVCDRAWLHNSLQTLEAAGLRASRIAAECTPLPQGTARLLLSADLEPAQMLLCTAHGVDLLPLQEAAIHRARQHTSLEVFAEPSVMALAEKHFGTQVGLLPRAERLLQAAQSPWNLAQLELTASASGRMAKRLGTLWQHMARAPQWRPARWALLALVVVQLVALNAVAWRQRKLLDDKREAIAAVLQQSFPDVKLVVNAPLQMQRAVDDLARSRGAGADADLGRVLALVTPLLPANAVLNNIDLHANQVRLSGSGLDEVIAGRVQAVLESQGLRARFQDGALVIEPKETR